VGTIKVYSPVTNRELVLYERKCSFIKPINSDNNLLAKKWSLGTGYYTNNLRLVSDSTANGLSMEQFYTDYVYDYGVILQDLVAKKIPNVLGGVPSPPVLGTNNFKVVQINTHLTDTPDSNLIKQKHNYQLTLQSEIQQISDAIVSRNKTIKVTQYKSDSDKKATSLEIDELVRKKIPHLHYYHLLLK
jgi:hypothetical protein